MIKFGLAQFGFFRIPLAFSLPLVLTTSVLAQDPAPDATGPTVRSFNDNGTEEATTERVFVTGSAIPTAAEVGPNPVLNVTRDLINKIRRSQHGGTSAQSSDRECERRTRFEQRERLEYRGGRSHHRAARLRRPGHAHPSRWPPRRALSHQQQTHRFRRLKYDSGIIDREH